VGVTTHAGVGIADGDVDAEGDGEEVTAVWPRPVHAATTAPARTVRVPSRRRRREINESRRGAITN